MDSKIVRGTIHDIYPVDLPVSTPINEAVTSNVNSAPSAVPVSDINLVTPQAAVNTTTAGNAPENSWIGWPGLIKMIIGLTIIVVVVKGYQYYIILKQEKERIRY